MTKNKRIPASIVTTQKEPKKLDLKNSPVEVVQREETQKQAAWTWEHAQSHVSGIPANDKQRL